MNNIKRHSEHVWMQLTAGQGPKEAGWVVAQLLKKVMTEACNDSLQVEVVESLAFDKTLRKQSLIVVDAYLSVLIRVEGEGASLFAQSWSGSIKWQGESPYRPKHKRINWFVGIELMDIQANKKIEFNTLQKEVSFESMRASGPGGQHVNKTNSAVRITHRPTGIQVRVESDRSQHRNRQLAMERLHIMLAAGCDEDAKAQERLRWRNHYQIKRGNPSRVFHGLGFVEQN